ncbi:MAG: TetR/AcrR family transcriptional regulator [Rhodothalassiaceae bacterium]
MTGQGTKPTTQARAAQTREKLIQALETLLKSKDFSQISVAEIAAEAGVAVGTVYRRFDNKEAFVPVLVERLRQRGQDALQHYSADGLSLPEQDLRGALRLVAAQSWQDVTANVHLYRTLYLYVRLKPELVAAGWEEIEQIGLRQFEDLLSAYADEITHPDLALATRMTAYLFSSLFIERGLFADVAAVWIRDLDGETLAREVADCAYAYLTAPVHA